VSSVREDSIANGTADIIVATYTINVTRNEKVSFAGPYCPEAEVVPFGQYSDCLEVRGEQFTDGPYGIGLAKDDTDFRTFINDVLEKIFEDGRWAEAWEATAGTVLPTPEPPALDRS